MASILSTGKKWSSSNVKSINKKTTEMRKLSIILLTLLLPLLATAGPVTEQQALLKAQQFMQGKTFTAQKSRRLAPKQDSNTAALYVFNAQEGGYAIVSGDDRTPAILGYSDKGHLDMDLLPEHIQSWLDGYAEQIAYLQEHPDAQVITKTLGSVPSVAPLLGETKWDQKYPYNGLCPVDDDGNHFLTGCVATAMAQIMYYHKWPAQTTRTIPAYTSAGHTEIPSIDVTTIDWDNMLPSYFSSDNPTENQKNAVAELMLLCGAAAKMEYTPDGSGSDGALAAQALRHYFNYNAVCLSRCYFDSDKWNQLVYEELSHDRPVLYDGMGKKGGHAFVIDGYDDNDFFHINWGWSGLYNGFFLLSVLDPNGDENSTEGFKSDQKATIGIQKNEIAPYAYATYENGTLAFYNDKMCDSRQGEKYSVELGAVDIPNLIPWFRLNKKEITKVVFDPSFSNVTPYSTEAWFYNMSELTTIEGIENLNLSKAISTASTFELCNNLSNLNLSSFNTANVKDMSSMFSGCSSLIDLDISSFNTANVKDMRFMFSGCNNLTNLDVSKFNTANVTDMNHMFCGCNKLTSLDVSKFNTANVTDMNSMFSGCSSLTNLDVSSFNTANVTNMSFMFYSCNNLSSLDVSKFNTASVTDMKLMFNNCKKLAELDVRKLNTANVTNMSNMFQGCNSLTNLDVSKFNTANVTNMSNMFQGCNSLTNLDVSKFNTANVTNMSNMFQGCNSLTNLDVSKFITDNVTKMSFMFHNCSGLTSLDVSKFNTRNVTEMTDMFSNCSSLTNLNVSTFNTENVTDMTSMFKDCSSITRLDVSKFDTQNVTDMNRMFYNCSGLTNLDVRNFNTANVTDMSYMFSGCSNLISLDVNNFKTMNVTSMNSMFSGCSNLISLDVNNFKTMNVTSMNSMFSGCSNLISLDVSNFNTANVTNMSSMLY